MIVVLLRSYDQGADAKLMALKVLLFAVFCISTVLIGWVSSFGTASSLICR